MLKRIGFGTLLVLTLVALASIEVPTSPTSGKTLQPAADSLRPADSTKPGFRVDNFNVQRGKGLDGLRDLGRAIEVLNGADIAGVQELSGTLFYGFDTQAEQIANGINLDHLYAPTTFRWLQPNKGSGLFSRYPVTNWSIERLPDLPDSDANPRNLIRAIVVIEDRPVTLLVTHLDRRENNALQLEFVMNAFRETEGPIILLGDLNTDHFNEALMTFIDEAGAVDAIHESIGHFWRLDWIITRGFNVLEGGYTPRGISDHAHYWVQLDFAD